MKTKDPTNKGSDRGWPESRDVTQQIQPFGRQARALRTRLAPLAGAIMLGWAGLFSLYVRGRLIWGHWPRGGPEDPKDVGEGLHYALAGYSAATLAICTGALFVVLAVFAAVEEKGVRSAKVVALTTAILSVLMIRFSPLVWWYLDQTLGAQSSA